MKGLITPFVYYNLLKYTIKAQSLEAMLPAIILIRGIFRVSIPEQDTTKKKRFSRTL